MSSNDVGIEIEMRRDSGINHRDCDVASDRGIPRLRKIGAAGPLRRGGFEMPENLA